MTTARESESWGVPSSLLEYEYYTWYGNRQARMCKMSDRTIIHRNNKIFKSVYKCLKYLSVRILSPGHCRFSSLLAHNKRNEHSFLPFLVLVCARWEIFAPLWIPAQLRSEEGERRKEEKTLPSGSPVVVLIIIRGTGFVIILYVYHRPFLCPYQSWREGCPITNVAERDLVSALPSSS